MSRTTIKLKSFSPSYHLMNHFFSLSKDRQRKKNGNMLKMHLNYFLRTLNSKKVDHF